MSRFKVVSQNKNNHNSICFYFLVVFVDLFIYFQWSGVYSWDNISPAMSVVEFRAGRYLKTCMAQVELENPEPVLKDVWLNCSWMLPSRRFPSCPCRPFHCLAVFTIRQVFYCLNEINFLCSRLNPLLLILSVGNTEQIISSFLHTVFTNNRLSKTLKVFTSS